MNAAVSGVSWRSVASRAARGLRSAPAGRCGCAEPVTSPLSLGKQQRPQWAPRRRMGGKGADAAYSTPAQTVTPSRTVPDHIPFPPYARGVALPPNLPPMERHDARGVEAMRAAGALAAEMLELAGGLIEEGVTTEEIDAQVHAAIVARGAYPSPLGYAGFPKSLCASINEVVCHGIPDTRPLERGDVVKFDVSCWLDGHHGDTCRTWIVGGAEAVEPDVAQLVEVTKRALDESVALCGPGVPYSAIGDKIADVLEPYGYGSVRQFTGHGVGRTFHTLPRILHFRTADYGKMQPGTTFTIEPMVTAGDSSVVVRSDGWAVATVDGRLSAQFEHSLLITEDGVEVLTAYE